MQIGQKILKGESSETELVYELSAKNILESKDTLEVAIAIDSSYSMVENADTNLVKQKIKSIAQKIINQNSRAKVSISDNTAVKVGLSNNVTYTNNATDAITFGTSSSFKDAIIKANSTFTSQNSDKYIILLTDATDSVKEELMPLVDQNITVISVLYDITNNEIGTPDNQVFGPVYMFNDLDDQQLVDYINKALTNLQLKANLTDEIVKYFDIEILTDNSNISVNNGEISWNIEKIKNKETVSIKYKLKLKNDAEIDRNIIYKNWFSAKEVTIDYTNILQKQVKIEQENTPKFTVGESYKLEIKAVNEKNINLPVEGIAFRVEGKDEEGKVVYNNTLTTDKDGYVTINKLITLNKVTFSIKPIVNQVGYEDTDETIVVVDNDYLGRRVIEVTTDGLKYDVDDIERIVEVIFPIKVQGFTLELNLSEEGNKNNVISNTEFRLIQPKLNSKYEMEALYGETDSDGKLFFRPAVMTKPGTYDYILSQMNEQEGYSSMGNVTVRLTFNDQGKITNIRKLYNDQVEAELVNDEYARLYIGNEYELKDTFDFEINLKDAVTKAPLSGASYNVVLTNSKGVSYTYGQNITDNDGKIKLQLPGTGYISLRVTQNTPATGYVKDTQAKDILIQRLNGEVKYIISKTPTDLDVICNTIEDKVIMNLTSTLKQDRNIVKVGVFDKGETPAYAIEGVTYKLVNETTKKEYDALTTNAEGQVEFTVDDEEPGTYRYKLVATNIPYGYVAPEVPVTINITFDSNKHIIQAGEVQGEIDTINTNIVSQDKDQLYTVYVETNLQLNDNQYVFEIDLRDIEADDKGQRVPIEGAIYDIEIAAGNFSKKIVGRPTDAEGKISTRIAIDPNAVGEITVTATQKSSKVGYKADIIPQEITLNLASKKITHTPEENDNGLIKYAELNENKIIYHHTNRRKDATDTFLNLNITTLDKLADAPIGGKVVNITSPVVTYKDEEEKEETTKEILDSNGEKLDSTKITSTIDGETGYVSFEDMKIVGARIPGEQTYEMHIKVDGNLIRTKLTFKYNEEKEIIELVNVEVMWGNRLVKSRNYSSAETPEGYISDVNLEIYTDYDTTGNVSLDLKKKDLEQKEDLGGALYDVIIQRPDGTSVIKTEVPITEAVEFDGIYVPVNSQIIITENKAPAGYNVNNSIILNVTEIDELTGETTLVEDTTANSYKIPRTYLEKQPSITLSDGTVQSVYVLEMYDVQQDIFEIKLGVKDTEGENVSGYGFELTNDRGAQKTTGETGEDGTVQETLGGRYNDENSPRIYTITNVKTGKYYKKLQTPIELKVYFKADETIDAVKTLAGQTDAKYTTTPKLAGDWTIVQVNKVDDEGNILTDIELQIIVEENDPLKVEIETIDKFTNKKIATSNLDYEIVNNLGTTKGEASSDEKYKFDVKYVLENGVETYKINQNFKTDLYTNLKNLYFTITYDENGQISKLVPPTSLSDNITIQEAEGQTIKLQVAVEPNVPFVVNNSYYFNHDTKLPNAEFSIVKQDNSTTITTDPEGKGTNYLGKFGNSETIRYKVTNTKASQGYAKIDDFEIDVTYNENREITDAKLVVEDNRFVSLRAIQPSQTTDYGYSGNDKGIVEINVFAYPEFKMNIKNIDRHTKEVISGTNYKVTSTINTQDESVTTGENGIGVAHLDKTAFETTVTYTIEENYPAVKYQSLLVPAKVEIDFDKDGYAKAVRVVKRDDVTNASLKTVSVVEDNFEVNVEIESTKAVALNITKVDEETKDTIEKVDFTVTARISEDELKNYSEEEKSYIIMDSSEQTENEYYEQVLDRLKYDPEDVENIKKDIAIERLLNQLKQENKLTSEQQEQVNSQVNSSAKFNYLVAEEIITKAEANSKVNLVTYKEVVEKLVADKTVAKQEVEDYLELVKKLVRLDVDRVTTNANGQVIAYMDKALANKTIEYTIKETKKAVGYDWPDEVVILEITYDAEGKIVADRIRKVSGNMEITDVNINEFEVKLTIGNTPSKEVKIHLTVEDVYDTNKKLGTVEFDAFLTDTKNGASISADEKYKTILASNGPVKDTEGKLVLPESQEGEDETELGLYEENAGTRTLRLVQKTRGNDIYSYGIRNDGNKKWVKDIYQDIPYLMLFNVTFNDEGSITDTSIQSPGGETQWGVACDERYVTISHTRNTINITVRMYPMLQIGMNTPDKYTNEYLETGFRISTSNEIGAQSQRVRITSGWIGRPETLNAYRGTVYSMGYTTTPEESYILSGIAPIESEQTDSKERTYYIYENQEPTSKVQYQKYRPWHVTQDIQRIIGAIKVRYDDNGRIIHTEVLEEHSNNNITNGFTTIELINNENDHGVYINVKYAPITTVEIKAEDKISEKAISGIEFHPYQNKTPVTEKPYEYRTYWGYSTNSNGVTNWTYWGANIDNGKAVYKMYVNRIKEGYLSYAQDTNIEVEVTYANDGRIASARVLSKNTFDDYNVFVDESCYGTTNLKLTYKLERKVGLQINKKDKYDSNINLSAKFKITSDLDSTILGNTDFIINTGSRKPQVAGRMLAGKTVTYTLSEITVPDGYKPLDNNLKLVVKYNNDGSVASCVPADSEFAKYITVNYIEQTPRQDKSLLSKDIEITITNEPKVNIDLQLVDEFYNNIKIPDTTFEITNNKGDVAVGNLTTNSQGKISTYVGSVYPGETVTYTMTQKTKASGYYILTEPIQFTITFDQTGKAVDIPTFVNQYSNENATLLTNNVTTFRQNHTASFMVYNMPEDVKLLINKYDELTNLPLQGVNFKITVEEDGTSYEINNISTNSDGQVIKKIDTFKETQHGRIVKYTISEVTAADTYRKVNDLVITITYAPDGSIQSWIEETNESDLSYTIFRRGNTGIKATNGNYTHFNLNVPNDNCYDLIIKDEDINYEGFGVEGTRYDVTINGVEKKSQATNGNGTTSIVNNTENGNISIRIAEREIGDGYRENKLNNLTLEITKAETGAYTLALNEDAMKEKYTVTKIDEAKNIYEVLLDEETDTKAIVEVNEEYGYVKVTFKNETKLELTLNKQDVNTKQPLQNVKFKVTETNLATNEVKELVAEGITDINGQIYLDLGVAPQNASYKYTFEELEVPSGYQVKILPQTVAVTFDMYGRISDMVCDSKLRTRATIEHGENCRSIQVFVGNGTIDPSYRVKVVSEDADTGFRINGSTFDVDVLDTENKTVGNTLNSTTMNWCSDGRFYSDEEIKQKQEEAEKNNTKFNINILERGLIYTLPMKYSGKLYVHIDQIGFSEGYVAGTQKTGGVVELTTKFVDNPNGSLDSMLDVTIDNNDGLEVVIDQAAREIIIKVKNESRLQLNIEKVTKTLDDEEKEIEVPVQGANFTVTSQVLSASAVEDTDLNLTTRATGANGKTSEAIGNTHPLKAVIYNIHENELEGYEPIEDISIYVLYDTRGYIRYYELLSSYEDAEIIGDLNGTRRLDLKIRNNAIIKDYKFVIEKHNIDNELYPQLIAGVEFNIKFEEEYGETKEWNSITNYEGQIHSDYYNGYGNIKIALTEIATVEGYKLDSRTLNVVLNRNKYNGRIEKISSDVNIEIDEKNGIIYLKPVNDFEDNKYAITIDKIDAKTKKNIENNPAKFDVIITNEAEEITYQDAIENMQTDETGRATKYNLDIPGEAGSYIYEIIEKEAPEGYVKYDESYKFRVIVAERPNGDLYIDTVEKISGDHAYTFVVKPQSLAFRVENLKEDNIVEDDEFAIDITKVDADGNAITESTAIFLLTLPDGTKQYAETEEGRLNLEHFKFPEQAGTVEYVLQEIMAPEGYIINTEPITIKLEFVQNEEGKIVLNSSNIVINAPGKNVASAKLEDGVININVTNIKGTPDVNVDRGSYNLILTKIDADTKQIIPREAEITVGLENGQRILSRTKEDAKIKILKIKAPAKAGEYEYVIKETKAPDGYILNEEPQIFKITFEENPQDPTQLIITDAKEVTDDTVTPIIHVTSYANNTVEINVENKKDETEHLYLKSKIDDKNEVIYNVYQKEDVPFTPIAEILPEALQDTSAKLYTINEPVIDTKTMLDYKSYAGKMGTTVKEFIANLDTNADVITIYDKNGKGLIVANLDGKGNVISICDNNGNALTGEELIKTGYSLKATKGSEELNYKISVKGDVNGDGILSTADSTATKRILALKLPEQVDTYNNNWTLLQKIAADNSNPMGLLTTKDSTGIKRLLAKPIPVD